MMLLQVTLNNAHPGERALTIRPATKVATRYTPESASGLQDT